MGFKDGTANVKAEENDALAQHVTDRIQGLVAAGELHDHRCSDERCVGRRVRRLLGGRAQREQQ